MDRHFEKKTPEQMIESIFALDLDPIKFKLMDKKEGHGWTREEADRRETEYKRFLALIAKFPEDAIVPDTDVDKFWHAHILDTMKYAEDCQHVFGYFLHHFPYFGMRDDEDATNLADAAANTRRLYQQEFGNAAASDAGYCAATTSSYCARVAGESNAASDSSSAYCAAPAASYCARVAGASDKAAAYCAAPTASYCARAADHATANASYCARAAIKADAYCAATNAAYYGTVLGKGRPKLEPASA